MELVVTPVVLAELTKELVMMIDNSINTESNNTSTKANTTDRAIDPMSLFEQIDIGILVTALANALPDRDGDIPMQ
ncbi:hypothetical protein N7471_008116 [Penicillium samsonianum]|uniref:uncharacterized protein n=1 Tax=Penicillium samsonianum TaxID=1882272 RepID=UPI002548D89A|nr:uncharacterized protein N7471_008116 [Penicillium samsonianum]KAJ6132901.1 hypothetical protein N7471_008116 [Penicillium samsonianum]